MATISPGSIGQTKATERFEGLDPEQLIRAFRWMHTARRLDDREVTLKRQNRIFFQISGRGARGDSDGRGHGAAAGLRLVLSLLPRPRAVPGAGRDAATRCCSRQWARRTIRRRAGGRCRRTGAIASYNIVSAGRRPPARSLLQAVGCAEAARYRRTRERRSDAGHLGRWRHQRRRILGSAECGLPEAAAGAVSGRGQRLRHLAFRWKCQTAGGSISSAGLGLSRTCSGRKWTAPIFWRPTAP